jgi:hypothetical protein
MMQFVLVSCGALQASNFPGRFGAAVSPKVFGEVAEIAAEVFGVSPNREQRFSPKLGAD